MTQVEGGEARRWCRLTEVVVRGEGRRTKNLAGEKMTEDKVLEDGSRGGEDGGRITIQNCMSG